MKKNILLMLTCILLCLSLLFTFAFDFANADHDCVGEECHICIVIQQHKSLLRDLVCVALLLMSAVFLSIGVANILENANRRGDFYTPITLKVKLLN